MIREKFLSYSKKYAMLPPGCRVLSACSGGADSTALLHLLCSLPEIEVVCAHFNHRLRGEESQRDAIFVRNICASLGVECVCGEADVAAYAAEHRQSIETAARALRYEFLEETAAQRHCDRIATAHHAEDNAETVLLNLIRGAGTRGLCGIPPVRGKIVRPLLNATRGEILDYLSENGLAFAEDSSNALDDCARNRVRHRILPLLAEENPSAIDHIASAAELLSQDEEYLSACAERFVEERVKENSLPIPAFLALPEAIGARVLRLLLGQLSRTHVAAVYTLCRSGEAHGAADLPGQRVRKEKDCLVLRPTASALLIRREIHPGETLIPELGLRILRRPAASSDEIHNSFNTFFFKSDSIGDTIFVDSRGAGESVRLLGRGCTKTLKKLFSEAGLTLAQRARTPVLYDERGVIAVFGFGIAERCAAAPGDAAICVTILEQETK